MLDINILSQLFYFIEFDSVACQTRFYFHLTRLDVVDCQTANY